MDSSLGKTTNKGKDQIQTSHCTEARKESLCQPLESCKILQKRCCRGNLKERDYDIPCNNCSGSHVPSTVSIIEMARSQLHHYTSKKPNCSIASNSLDADCGLSPEASEDLELAFLLQASAERFSNQQFKHARKFLSLCNQSASATGTPVQRLVYCFGEALREIIDKETKSITSLPLDRPGGFELEPIDHEEVLLCPKPHVIACYQELPFFQVAQFAGIQAILDNVKLERRLHLIDFGIKSGSHWIILMQALANRGDCPLELLKITAVGTSKQMIEDIGQRLSSFVAEEMKVPFSFKAVVSEMRNLSKDLFEIDSTEAVAVYTDYRLAGMLAWPDHLEAVLRFIKSLNPCVMVVIDTEANTNAPTFMERFNEALFLYAAVFDSLQTCMGQNNQYRMAVEGLILRKIIHNMIASEGEERIFRNVRLEVWRALFDKFGIKETELSESSLYQAHLLAERTAPGSCSLEMDGKGFIIKWKGTSILFASAWKFHHD